MDARGTSYPGRREDQNREIYVPERCKICNGQCIYNIHHIVFLAVFLMRLPVIMMVCKRQGCILLVKLLFCQYFILCVWSFQSGRLLLRKVISYALGIPYKDINLGRTEKGKPYLLNKDAPFLSFNISHQGDYAVLVADTKYNVGIDVMKVEYPSEFKICK